jgi:hypothetical protein
VTINIVQSADIPRHETAEFTSEDLGLHARVGEEERGEKCFPNLLGAEVIIRAVIIKDDLRIRELAKKKGGDT